MVWFLDFSVPQRARVCVGMSSCSPSAKRARSSACVARLGDHESSASLRASARASAVLSLPASLHVAALRGPLVTCEAAPFASLDAVPECACDSHDARTSEALALSNAPFADLRLHSSENVWCENLGAYDPLFRVFPHDEGVLVTCTLYHAERVRVAAFGSLKAASAACGFDCDDPLDFFAVITPQVATRASRPLRSWVQSRRPLASDLGDAEALQRQPCASQLPSSSHSGSCEVDAYVSGFRPTLRDDGPLSGCESGGSLIPLLCEGRLLYEVLDPRTGRISGLRLPCVGKCVACESKQAPYCRLGCQDDGAPSRGAYALFESVASSGEACTHTLPRSLGRSTHGPGGLGSWVHSFPGPAHLKAIALGRAPALRATARGADRTEELRAACATKGKDARRDALRALCERMIDEHVEMTGDVGESACVADDVSTAEDVVSELRHWLSQNDASSAAVLAELGSGDVSLALRHPARAMRALGAARATRGSGSAPVTPSLAPSAVGGCAGGAVGTVESDESDVDIG